MKSLKKIDKIKCVLLLGALGFLFTGGMFYPYGLFWDSARVMSYIIVDGHANVDNWLGWYFPLLMEVLYKLTGIPNIMGVYINFLYWVGVSLLYINVFNVDKRSLWWYVAFAWFPGTLMFIVNITNNALMMVMLVLGLAFFALYMNKKKFWWLILSLFTIIQCCFIRRESFVMIIPLVIVLMFIYFVRKNNKRVSIISSIFFCIALFFVIFGLERYITSKISNYHYMDAISITCLHDMSAVTFSTGKMCIPKHIFKEQFSDGKACFNDIMSMESGKDSIYSGDIMFHHIGPYMKLDDRYKIILPLEDIKSFYLHNFATWLKFRVQYIYQFLCVKHQMCYQTQYDGNMILYYPPQPKALQKALSYAVPTLFGSLQIFYYLIFIIVLLDIFKIINYSYGYERLLIYTLLSITIVETILVLFTSISIQYRYIYPVCVLTYMLFIYILSRLKYKEIGKKLECFEQ